MKTTTEYAIAEKLEALRVHLINEENFTEEEAAEATFDERYDSFKCGSWEYKVFTDEEANEATREEILGSLWAFRPEFILKHTAFYKESSDNEDREFCKALERLQAAICEGANAIVKALIMDVDEFVNEAIRWDSRGNFLSTYDGEEHESACGRFYIYRIN